MAYQLTFGSYTFPKGFYPAEEPGARVIGGAKLPRADGARILTGYLDRKKFVIRGGLIKGPFDSSALRTRLDLLKAALPSGPANLTFDSDRYWRNVQVETLSLSYEGTGYNRIATVQIDLTGPDPFQYDSTGSTDSWAGIGASGSTRVIAAGGNAYARPVLSITVGGAGAVSISFTITNQATGEAFTLSGTCNGGDVIVVDCLAQTVTIGGVDKFSLFDGQWLRLNVGNNTIKEEYTVGTLTAISTAFNNRYW